MELSLKNFKTILSAELVKRAKKNAVRECDEINKGHFQSYVDDKNDSYDALVVVNSKGVITTHQCDCGCLDEFCHHKTTLLLFLIKEKQLASKQQIAKKANQLETLIYDTAAEEIKAWLIDLLKKNKDLELAFLHQFSPQKKEFNPDELKRLTLDAVKSIVKNRKKLEIAEVKKIVELWVVLHESVIVDYIAQPADKVSFLKFNAIMEACEEIRRSLNTSSGRLAKYQEDLLERILMPLNQIKDEEYWDRAVGYFVDCILGEAFGVRIYYLSFLVELHEGSSPDRQQYLAKSLVAQFMRVDPERFYNGDTYTSIIFRIIVKSGLFQEYYLVFKPLLYRNEHNVLLIGLLIEYGYLPIAEKYCLEQIARNSKDDYDMAYLNFLIQIYTLERDDDKLAKVLKETLPKTFDFKTYLFVNDHLEEGEEKKKWRSKLLAKARQSASYHLDAMFFAFHLLDHEGNYKKMIQYVDANATYQVIAQYAEEMALVDKANFLKQLIYKTDNLKDNYTETGLAALEGVFKQLLDILIKHYTRQGLMLSIKEARKWVRYYSPNRLVEFLERSLQEEPM